jgi:hypothetical protein
VKPVACGVFAGLVAVAALAIYAMEVATEPRPDWPRCPPAAIVLGGLFVGVAMAVTSLWWQRSRRRVRRPVSRQ